MMESIKRQEQIEQLPITSSEHSTDYVTVDGEVHQQDLDRASVASFTFGDIVLEESKQDEDDSPAEQRATIGQRFSLIIHFLAHLSIIGGVILAAMFFYMWNTAKMNKDGGLSLLPFGFLVCGVILLLITPPWSSRFFKSFETKKKIALMAGLIVFDAILIGVSILAMFLIFSHDNITTSFASRRHLSAIMYALFGVGVLLSLITVAGKKFHKKEKRVKLIILIAVALSLVLLTILMISFLRATYLDNPNYMEKLKALKSSNDLLKSQNGSLQKALEQLQNPIKA
ncbi:hypothetical protein NEFER03_0929 [Nematocida sp. LUAm3]|nr:hypothetical protein NEFER03_0929 [Nematocida sp. LUAm3]KAI5174947.1 hypothetical protein NEFER02_1047 [Nematocida sp. LUAm2]KAI5177454.1 hypothetical protein NEFER01_0704 [Nematocida sp. LUAm1]